MRDPVFRFRGLWHRQYGGAGGGDELIGGMDTYTPGASSFTVPAGGRVALVYIYGGGGGGGGGANPVPWSGAGGGACYLRVPVTPGQVFQYNIGANPPASGSEQPTTGGAVAISSVGGVNMTAWGGNADHSGGTSSGGSINRRGGASVQPNAGNNGTGAVSPDPGGGNPGTGGYNPGGGQIYSGGGAGAGFGDHLPLLKGGDGGNGGGAAGPAGARAGGGTGTSQSGPTVIGSNGRVTILVLGSH